MSETMKLNTIRIEQEVVIEAPASKVFKSLTEDIAAWWGAPYLISEQAQDIILEPVLGGRCYEVWGENEGALWATVTGIHQEELLELTGSIRMGGVVHGVVRFSLERRGNAQADYGNHTHGSNCGGGGRGRRRPVPGLRSFRFHHR